MTGNGHHGAVSEIVNVSARHILCWIFAQRQTAFEIETLFHVVDCCDLSTNIEQKLWGTSAYWAKSFHGNWKKEKQLAEGALLGNRLRVCNLYCTGTSDGILLQISCARLTTTVTSHVAQRPDCHGRRVRPSGHLPSRSSKPWGSFSLVTPAWVNERQNDVIKVVMT